MGLTKEQINRALNTLAVRDPAIARALEIVGYPAPRMNDPGYRTLLKAIVGQQVSVAAADSVWRKLETLLGPHMPPEALLAQDYETLRGCGLSRQKQGYARSLCELLVSGDINLATLPQDDEAAIAELVQIKGIGRWSAEIYLLFAEGREDIWPAGDLGVQGGLQRILQLDARPAEKATRQLAENWRPHRGALALFTWSCHGHPALLAQDGAA